MIYQNNNSFLLRALITLYFEKELPTSVVSSTSSTMDPCEFENTNVDNDMPIMILPKRLRPSSIVAGTPLPALPFWVTPAMPELR